MNRDMNGAELGEEGGIAQTMKRPLGKRATCHGPQNCHSNTTATARCYVLVQKASRNACSKKGALPGTQPGDTNTATLQAVLLLLPVRSLTPRVCAQEYAALILAHALHGAPPSAAPQMTVPDGIWALRMTTTMPSWIM